MENFRHLTITDVEANVYYGDTEQNRYFVKVSLLGTGIHINSISVSVSQINDSWWVQPPKHRQGSRYTSTVDFDKSYPLWELIEQRATAAVEIYKNGGKPKPTAIVLNDIPF